MGSFVALLFGLTFLLQFGQSSYTPRSIHERRHVASDGWVKKARAPSSAFLPVRIALTQNDIQSGHDLLMEISDPESVKYAQHLSAQEVMERFRPTEDTVIALRDWLVASGVELSRHRHNGFYIDFDATVEEMERLLETEYHVNEHLLSGTTHIACDEYSLPHTVKPHVDFIIPTIGHTAEASAHKAARAEKRNTLEQRPGHLRPIIIPVENQSSIDMTSNNITNLSKCHEQLRPACVRALYDIPIGQSNMSGNTLGIFEDSDYYDTKDLNLFLAAFTNIPVGTVPRVVSIDGGIAPYRNEAGSESMIDLDVSMPLIYPQGVEIMQTDDIYVYDYRGFFDTWLDALDASYCTYDTGPETTGLDPVYPDPRKKGYHGNLQCGTVKSTNVISISYLESEYVFPPAYTARQCYEYMKLALQGITLVFASGDSGAGVTGYYTGQFCLEENGKTLNKTGKYFVPSFPASCPYVLAVGGTQIAKGNTVKDPEVAAFQPREHFSSGGGFSNRSSMPSYQKAAVQKYLQDTKFDFPRTAFNQSGRAYPDVSANGVFYPVYLEGKLTKVVGTSQAAPIWASILTLINEERLKANKTPVGFVNPVLYKNPQAFHDIVSGMNLGCNNTGFPTAPGWDAVTGLGTPNYPELLNVFMSLP